ncbi:phage late control D family protein [Xenorhabdus bovienii]|uniref:phage late control D family protein n=1 Tax=Xenorhabdus bovienii TaxID=40576 RepID=UPI00237CEBEE|nr:phage late control D family protein [Xenorhabdus bovienii]MDE1481025.1 phage late control D family protein [Xenorhabdus bovienii]
MIDSEQWTPNTDWIPQFDLVTGKNEVPAFRLETNNKDISGRIQSRLISLTLTDNRGLESDQLDIELDDADGMLRLPSRGDILTLELGWHGHPLTPKGKFIVDEIEHVGAPDRLTVRARSADFRGDLNVKREVSYHERTLSNIVSTVAVRNKLKSKMSAELRNISTLIHIDQTNESDVSFLTRLAKQEGAIASVKNGELLFIRQGQNKTSSGTAIPPVLITRESGDNHRFSLSDREAYTGVVAQWLDTRKAKKQTVKLTRKESETSKTTLLVEYNNNETRTSGGKASQQIEKTLLKNTGKSVDLSKDGRKSQGKEESGSISMKANSALKYHQTTTVQQEASKYLAGTEENVLTLSHMYSNQKGAERAAKAVWEKMQRGAAQFSITLAKGREDIYPETPIQLKGFKPEIDGTNWTLVKVTHMLNDSGFTTSLDLEIKIDDVEMNY